MKRAVTGAILVVILAETLWTAICVRGIQASGTDAASNDPLVDATSVIMNPGPSNGLDETGGYATRNNQVREECGTITLLETRVLKEDSVFGMQNKSGSSLIRPTDSYGGFEGKQHILPKFYGTANFMFHWTDGTDGGSLVDAVFPLDSNANGIPDHVENFGVIFEDVRDFLLNSRGFLAPPTDAVEPNDQNSRNPDGRYDVFFYTFGAGGYARPEQSPNSSSYSHIGLRSDYTGWALPWFTDLGVMQTTAAHEFFHAIQFAYNCNAERWWDEATATYMEDEVYPDVNQNYWHLWAWFRKCDVNGLFSWYEEDHKYGDFIFAKRLSEDFGDGIIKEIWEEIGKSVKGLTAIGNVLQSKNTTLVNEFSRFITANFFLEEMYADGTDYRSMLSSERLYGVWLKYQYNASTAADNTGINETNAISTRTDHGAWMDSLGTSYVTMKLDPARQRYHIFFDGLDLTTNYLVKMVTKKGGVINETLFDLDDQKEGYVDLEYDVFENVTLIMANAGNTSTHNPSWRVTITMPPKPPPPVYDVAIIALSSSTDYAFSGDTITIALTVKNNGATRNEDFTVSVYWGALFLVGERQIMGLAPATAENVTVTWTIPQGLNETHRIWANATRVSDETDQYNNRLDGEILEIVPKIHDFALTSINPYRTIVSNRTTTSINITVTNQGTLAETLNVTIYVNSTGITNQTFNLPNGNLTFFTFVWNTTDLQFGNYTLTAEANQVAEETDLADNNLSCTVRVSMLGDINGDGRVDMKDVSRVAAGFQLPQSNPKWASNGDLDENGVIDMKDISTIAKHFGEHYP